MKRPTAVAAWMFVLGAVAVSLTMTVPTTLAEEFGAGRDDVVAPLGRALHLLAAGLAWYLVSTTGIAIAGRVLRYDVLATVGDRLSLPAARFIVGSALGVSAFTPVQPVQPVLAEQAPPTPIEADDVPTMEMLSGPSGDTVRGLAAPQPAPPSTVRPRVSPVASAANPSVTVVPGDHLWSISAKHLEATGRRPPTDAEIARYWSAVVEVNVPRLASGDPDLIRPGEVIELPPVPADWVS